MAWRLIETRELLGEDGIPGQIKIYDVGDGALEAEITIPLHREEQADLLVELLAELWRNLNSGSGPPELAGSRRIALGFGVRPRPGLRSPVCWPAGWLPACAGLVAGPGSGVPGGSWLLRRRLRRRPG